MNRNEHAAAQGHPLRRFGRRGSDPDAADRAAESLRAIEAGGLPHPARERLAKLRDDPSGAFTSDLTTAEFLLLRQAGFKPLSQVMGSCVFQVGFQNVPGNPAIGTYVPEGQATPRGQAAGFEYDDFGRRVYHNAAFGQVFELAVHTEAWQKARGLALGRLAEEARLAGAAAVVGIHLRRGSYDWGQAHDRVHRHRHSCRLGAL